MNISRRQLYAAGEPLGECVSHAEVGRRVMGGGGGGPQNSTTVQSIPDELKPLATQFTNKAIGLSNQSFQPFQGQRFADLNPTQNMGIGMIQDRALNGSPVMDQANSTLMQTLQGGQTNPFLEQMVNKAQANVLSNARAADMRSGSFGNSGVAEQAARQMGDVATTMFGQAFEADRGRQMQALGMAPTFANQDFTDASQLLKAGQIQQDQQQQGLDFNFGQFQEAQNLPFKQLAAMSGVFGSNLGGTSTTTSTGGGK